MQQLERFLLLVELVVLREQLLEALGDGVHALVELRHVLVFGRERVHAAFRFTHRRLQHPEPLIERLELLLSPRRASRRGRAGSR